MRTWIGTYLMILIMSTVCAIADIEQDQFNTDVLYIYDDLDDFGLTRHGSRALWHDASPCDAYHEDWLDRDQLAISLGYNCTSAFQLNDARLRYRSFPFDWCFSPIHGIIKCLDNDFKDFMSLCNLVPDRRKTVRDSVYDIIIVHDYAFQDAPGATFQDMYQDCGLTASELIARDHPQLYEKMMRRVQRFKSLSNYRGKLYFIRCLEIDKKHSIALLASLKRRFPNQDITLIVINNTPDFEKPWGIKKLHNFYIPKLDQRTLEPRLLRNIFERFGLV